MEAGAHRWTPRARLAPWSGAGRGSRGAQAQDGRQLIRLRMPPAEDASRPWARPLLLMSRRPDEVRSTTMRPNELAGSCCGRSRGFEAAGAPGRVSADRPMRSGPVAPGMRTDSGRGPRAVIGTAAAIVGGDPGLWLLGLAGFGARGGLVLLTLPVLTIPSPVLLSILFRSELGTSGRPPASTPWRCLRR